MVISMSKTSKNKISDALDKYFEENILEENIENIFGERFGRYSKTAAAAGDKRRCVIR